VSEPIKGPSTLIGSWSTKATWSTVLPLRDLQERCLRIFKALTSEFGRFARILTIRCLLLMSIRSRLTNTTQIAMLIVFSFWVFRFLSLRESMIILLLERSGWGFIAITRESHRSKPDSLRRTSMSMRTSLSWMKSLSMPCFLVFSWLWSRCGQTSHNYLMMIMRGLSSYYTP
jgi:hypothetical protein